MTQHVLIIAEAGVNHNGDFALASELVHAAAEAKADIVKFQTFKADNLATKTAPPAQYQKTNMKGKVFTQHEMLKKLELRYEDHFKLIELCQKLKIGFLSTAFDFESLAFLQSLELGLWKIPSGEITNLPYLEIVGKLNQRTILSTGMSTLDEVRDAMNVLTRNGTNRENITVLHCNTDYPTAMRDVNLRAMCTMGNVFDVDFGYSDHTLGIEVPVAAVALGAKVIEKHFTLDRLLAGPDHAASLEPRELQQMVTSIRNIEEALGYSEKVPSKKELANKNIARKSIVARTAIKKGDLLTDDNITTSRPGNGLSPMRWHEILGSAANRDYMPGDFI